MRIQLIKQLFPIIIALVLPGCKKSEIIPEPGDQAVIKTVKQVSATTTDFVSYEYDQSGNVTKYVSQWQDGTGSIRRLNNIFEYSGNKLVRTSNEAGYGTFHYNGEVLSTSDHFASNNKKISTYLYEYNATGKLMSVSEQIANHLPDGASETKVAYQYYNDGNISRMDIFYKKEPTGPFVLSFSKVFAEYDDKKNPEPDGVLGFFLPGVVLQKNNPLKINNILPDGATESYSRYEYTYNPSGNPLTRKHFIGNANGEQSPVIFTYTY